VSIAVCVKVHDGLVLAADSATMVGAQIGGQTGVSNIYNNAEKITNLVKPLPIAMATVGGASIGTSSITTLAKDLRLRFEGRDEDHEDWKLDKNEYGLEDVCRRVQEFFYEEQYQGAYTDEDQGPDISFWVGGFSAGSDEADIYEFSVSSDGCSEPKPARDKPGWIGVGFMGFQAPAYRLMFGYAPELPTVLQQQLGVPEEQVGQAMDIIETALDIRLVQAGMPIQDAINLAEFLVDTTIKYTEFMPGAPIVGPPIDVAAITKHEGFKWVQRKHYFDVQLNPEVKQ